MLRIKFHLLSLATALAAAGVGFCQSPNPAGSTTTNAGTTNTTVQPNNASFSRLYGGLNSAVQAGVVGGTIGVPGQTTISAMQQTGAAGTVAPTGGAFQPGAGVPGSQGLSVPGAISQGSGPAAIQGAQQATGMQVNQAQLRTGLTNGAVTSPQNIRAQQGGAAYFSSPVGAATSAAAANAALGGTAPSTGQFVNGAGVPGTGASVPGMIQQGSAGAGIQTGLQSTNGLSNARFYAGLGAGQLSNSNMQAIPNANGVNAAGTLPGATVPGTSRFISPTANQNAAMPTNSAMQPQGAAGTNGASGNAGAGGNAGGAKSGAGGK
jgi:hypothetical protein